ncbi:MAG: hypothetical protein JO023_12950 [Chloroflexi bacterium]|nr:hypothetical protein [Chloroflexota bacterium]
MSTDLRPAGNAETPPLLAPSLNPHELRFLLNMLASERAYLPQEPAPGVDFIDDLEHKLELLLNVGTEGIEQR